MKTKKWVLQNVFTRGGSAVESWSDFQRPYPVTCSSASPARALSPARARKLDYERANDYRAFPYLTRPALASAFASRFCSSGDSGASASGFEIHG